MKSLVQYLSLRPKLNLVLAIIYFLLVVLPHEQVGLWTVDIFGHLPRSRYDAIILTGGIVLLLIYLTPLLAAILKRPNRKLLLISLITSIVLSIIAFRTLVIINIEIVHFFQYGFMALLIFPLVKHYGQTLLICTMLGAIDEAYQYFYLAPERTDYYDFNDVIINLLGATFGLVAIAAVGCEPIRRSWNWVWKGVFVVAVLGFGLYMAGLLQVYPPDENMATAPILLNRVGPPEGFWSEVHPKIIYRVVQPLEGVLITAGLLMGFAWLLDSGFEGSS